MTDQAPDADEGTRERILAVALHRFARAGYGKTSVKDIASEAGVTPGAVPCSFGSKPELYREAGKRALGRLVETYTRRSPPGGQSQRERVQSLFEEISANVHEHEDNHWIGISTELDAARYPSVAESRVEWDDDLQRLYDLAGATGPRDPVAVFLGVCNLGAADVVVRNGPEALPVAIRGLQAFVGRRPSA